MALKFSWIQVIWWHCYIQDHNNKYIISHFPTLYHQTVVKMKLSIYFILAFMPWTEIEARSRRLGLFLKYHSKSKPATHHHGVRTRLCSPTTCNQKCRVSYSYGQGGQAQNKTFCPTTLNFLICCTWVIREQHNWLLDAWELKTSVFLKTIISRDYMPFSIFLLHL